MFKLMKFEVKKKWKMHAITTGVFILLMSILAIWMSPSFKVANIVSFDGNGPNLPYEFIWSIVIASSFFGLSILDAINNIRIELKKNTRNLYFSVPLSAYKMIGAKLLYSIITIGIAGFLSLSSIILSLQYLVNFNFVNFIFENMPSITDMLWFFLASGLGGLNFLLLIYLTFAIYRAFFSQFKFGGLITFVLFVGISIGYNRLISFVVRMTESLSMDVLSVEFTYYSLGMSAVLAAIMFFVSGYLLENRANFD